MDTAATPPERGAPRKRPPEGGLLRCAGADRYTLAASLQVVRAAQRRRHVTVGDAREAVKRAAVLVATDDPGPETQSLVAKLEQATGISIAELAMAAEQWPDV